MKANELRIGNLVKQGIVESLGQRLIEVSDTIYELEDIKPIELNEEWIIKLGFKGEDGYYYDSETGAIEYYFENKVLVCDVIDRKNEKMKYVHQLQNLYFALTGKEINKQNDRNSEIPIYLKQTK